MKANYRAWEVNLDGFYGLKKIEDRLRFLIKLGLLAPSSHNSQPWIFEVAGNMILIKVQPKRYLSVSDINSRQLYISLGCVLENLLIAADYYWGPIAKVLYFPGGDPGLAVKIYFDHDTNIIYQMESGQKNHLVFSIPNRRTNRNKYNNQDLPISFLENASIQSAKLGVDVRFISNKKNRDAAADIVLDALGEAMADKNFRKELSKYIKSNFTSSKLGMPGFGMGIPSPVSLFLPFVVKYLNLAKLSRKQDEELLKNHTPIFGIVSTANDEPESWIKSGQAYERTALEAERIGIKTAVMAAAIQIGDYYQDLQTILQMELRPQVFFRLGYCDHAIRPSPRLNSEEVIEEVSRCL